MIRTLTNLMPVFWIVGAALGYAAVTYFITICQESFKEGRFWKEAGAFIVYLAVALILGRLVFRSAVAADWCAMALALVCAAGFLARGGRANLAGSLFLMAAACLAPCVLPIGQAAEPDGVGAVKSLRFFLACLLMFITVFAVYLTGYRHAENVFKKRSARRKFMSLSGATVILITGSVIFLAPFVWLLGTSFKESDQIMKFPPEWIPKRQISVEFEGKKCPVWTVNETGETVYELEGFEDGTVKVTAAGGGKSYITETAALTKVSKPGLKWENYPDALDFLPKSTKKGLVYLLNTVYVTLLSIIGTLFSCSLVAYSFARLRWPGKDIIFALLLATMMLPGAVTMIPVFMIFKYLGWVDTLNPLWVPSFFGSAFAVFLMRQFFMSIPRDLEEAARLDGAGYFKTFVLILMPLVKPALAALAIMTFMGSWNNFMGALIYINSPEKMTLAYGLQLFMGEAGIEYGMLMAASVLVILPVLIIFFFAQKHFIEGITLTGIKG
ncbi:MAG: carbohydrate ABC transporter permease [Abditibacteriota bacterium]|nr:carbohydrate ABC transporter permease [Abditibacteriota bacterium]